MVAEGVVVSPGTPAPGVVDGSCAKAKERRARRERSFAFMMKTSGAWVGYQLKWA
jgi:hypothetical protein